MNGHLCFGTQGNAMTVCAYGCLPKAKAEKTASPRPKRQPIRRTTAK